MPQSGLESGSPYSFREYTGDGSNKIFSITFPYLNQDHVKVYVNDVSVSFSFLTSSTVTLDAVPAVAAAIVVRRDTPYAAPVTVFSNGAALKGGDLNQNAQQLLYVVQEAVDAALLVLALFDAAEAARLAAEAAAALAAAEAANAATSATDAATSAASLQLTYELCISVPYVPSSGTNAGIYLIQRNLSLPAGSSSAIELPVAGLVNTLFSIQKNGVEVGTASVIAPATVGTVTVPVTTAFVAGDLLTVVSAVSDPGAAPSGVGITLTLSRTS